jgi:peptide deformylase
MKFTIVKYPHPVLLKPAEPVTAFDAELQDLVDGMFEAMYEGKGVGLAAPQVAVSKRVIVIDLSTAREESKKIVLVNPEIIESDGKQYGDEGCLSFPDLSEKVSRAYKVKVRAQNTKGEWFELEGEELLARCFQHEIDHVDGVVFLDRMTPLKRSICQRKIRKLQRDGDW